MFDSPFWLLLIPIVTVPVGVLIGMKTYRFFNHSDWDTPEGHRLRDQATPRNVPIPMFCRDCGKAMISYRSMDGYDTKTGQPSYSFQRGCGDATRTGGPNTPGTWPYCGNRTKQRDIAGGHIHADPEAASTDCAACVDTMLADGVLNYQQALALYAKIEFKKDDPELSDRMTIMYRSFVYPPGQSSSNP